MPKFLNTIEISTEGSVPPLVVNSTAKVLHLNASYLCGQSIEYFATDNHTHLDTYQPIDADLTAIAALPTLVSNKVLTKNANQAWELTERTGTGKIASEIDAVLVNPALGTPSSGDLSKCTGYKALERKPPSFISTPTDADTNKLYLGNDTTAIAHKLYAVDSMTGLMKLVDCGNAQTANQADNAIQLGGLPASHYSLTSHNHLSDYALINHDHTNIYSPVGHSHSQLLNVGGMAQSPPGTGYLQFDGTAWRTFQPGTADFSNTAGFITAAAATPSASTSTLVSRDTSGSFTANVITATLNGRANVAIVADNLTVGSAARIKLDSATANVGTVTSVSGTGTVNGLTLSGSFTGSGSITLGGTLSVTPTEFSGTLPVAKGGTGVNGGIVQNKVFASPNTSTGDPGFRYLNLTDLPDTVARSANAKVSTVDVACNGHILVTINNVAYKLMVTA